MLLENNRDLLKSPAVGISVPMRAALKKLDVCTFH